MSDRSPPDAAAWARNTIAVYAALIRDRIPFAQAVYGDGEWKSILGWRKSEKNDQGETYCDGLTLLLQRTLLEPAGQWCVSWPGRAGAATFRASWRWLADHGVDVSWIPFRPISWAATMGLAAPFFAACATRPVMLVGPSHLAKIPSRLLRVDGHIVTPLTDSWVESERFAEAVVEFTRAGDLVIFCSGQGATVMIHRAAELLDDNRYFGGRTLIDLGSMFDPYCGVMSRQVYRTETFRQAMEANIP